MRKEKSFQFPDSHCHFKNNRLHSNSSPAIIDNNGTKIWMQYGKIHRDIFPAVEFANGHYQYYKLGNLHRLHGPAIVSNNKEWWINGIELPLWAPKIEDNNIYGLVNNHIICKVMFEINVEYGLLLSSIYHNKTKY